MTPTIMTTYPQTITFGEMRRIRRARCVDLLPSVLLRQVGVVAVASLARQSPDSTADDDHLRSRIIDALGMKDLCPNGLGVIVRDGIVHLSGVITDERSRKAAIVCAENIAGVKKIHDHLCWVDPMSGLYLIAPEDDDLAKAG